mmetsp:Transcript_41436/g.96894  ORF Transcript_41436/g.96894 Transcript_41436/m.96894 type:complete len:493 (-) Transcript_41436:793-2271(-)
MSSAIAVEEGRAGESEATAADAVSRAFETAQETDPSMQPLGPRWLVFLCSSAKSISFVVFALLLPRRVQALAEVCLEEAGEDSDGSCLELWSAGDGRVEGIFPSWNLVMLPLLLFNVVQLTLRVFGLVDGTSWTRTRHAENARLGHLIDICAALCMFLFKLLLLFQLNGAALQPWWQIFVPIYIAITVQASLFYMRVHEPPPGPGFTPLDFNHLVLLNISLVYSSDGAVFGSVRIAMWPVWLWYVSLVVLAVVCLVLSLIYYLRFCCTTAPRPSICSPEFFILVGSFLFVALIHEGYVVLAQSTAWLDGGGKLALAPPVIWRVCNFVILSNVGLCVSTLTWALMQRARARRIGIQRQERFADLSTELPAMLIRQSSSLYRQASAKSKASLYLKMAYLKLREEEGLQPPASAAPEPPQSDEDSGECRYCETNPQEAVFLPCGHAGVCVSCASKWLEDHSTCPECRSEVKKLARLGEPRTVMGQVVVTPVPALI